MKRRFLVVDDHPVFRQGLVALIEAEDRYEVIAEAGTIEEALAVVTRTDLDIALVDISLKKENGLDLVRSIKSLRPKLPVLIVSMHDEVVYGERALKAGARGLVMKHEAPSEILEAIRTVLTGGVYLSSQMQRRIVESMYAASGDGDVTLLDKLTERELEVLEYIGQGYGAAEIAELLNLSVKTVHTYQERIKEKLQLQSSAEVRRYAVSWYRASHR